MPVERRRAAQVVQVARHVADQQAAVRQRPRPVVEPRLKRARPLPCLDAPAPDLHFFLDLQHARHLEDEAGLGERRFQHRPRRRVQLRGVAHQGELLLIGIAQGEEPPRLGPGEGAPYPDRALLALADGPEPAVGAALERELGDGLRRPPAQQCQVHAPS